MSSLFLPSSSSAPPLLLPPSHPPTHTHVQTHTHIHTHKYAHMYTHTHTHTQIRTHVRTHTHTQIRTHVHTHTHTLQYTLCIHCLLCMLQRKDSLHIIISFLCSMLYGFPRKILHLSTLSWMGGSTLAFA